MHAVPPPMTGNYMPSGPDIEIDYSQFTYGPNWTKPSGSLNPKQVWSDAPIIEEYESDSEDEYVSIPPKEQETPSFANQQVKTPRETVKNQFTHSQKPKVDKKELGYGFTVRACFVCGSLNHLIRDCDFHEKRMARKAELNNGWNRKSSQREIRQTWNNVQRVNKQNQFVPSAVLTRTGKIPVSTARASSTKNVSTARQSFNRQTILTSTAMKVNAVKPIVNRARPANLVLLGVKGKLLLSPQQVVIRDHKDRAGTMSPNTMVDPVLETDYLYRALKNKGIVDSGCSRHMIGNKAYLAEFQDFMVSLLLLEHFNLFSVSQMCDKKNKVLFTDSECLVLSPEFKLPDENQVLLKIPRQNNMYSFNLENIVPLGGLAWKGPTWLFDLDYLTDSMNYQPVRSENQANQHAGPQEANHNAGTKDIIDAGDSEKEDESAQDCFVLPIWSSYSSIITPDFKTDAKREGPREEEQVFLDELKNLRGEKRILNKAAEALGRSLHKN
ncbi:hypothetical protein Tco_1162912 [Tanacetum coccineum]